MQPTRKLKDLKKQKNLLKKPLKLKVAAEKK